MVQIVICFLPNFRCRVPIIASGGSASAQMVLFGEVAQKMIGKNADALVAESYDPLNIVPR